MLFSGVSNDGLCQISKRDSSLKWRQEKKNKLKILLPYADLYEPGYLLVDNIQTAVNAIIW